MNSSVYDMFKYPETSFCGKLDWSMKSGQQRTGDS